MSVVVQDVVELNNFIKNLELDSDLFAILWDRLDSHFSTLMLHAQVLWLFKGKSFDMAIGVENRT